MRRTIIYSLCCASLLLSSCDLDVPVTDRLPDEEVWKDDNLITGVFSRLYNQMQMEHNSTYFEGWDVWNVSLVTASDHDTCRCGQPLPREQAPRRRQAFRFRL